MTPEKFFDQMKLFLSKSEDAEATPNTNISKNIIAKPRKNYISARDVLTTFNINKDVYNNLLVRAK